MLSRPKQSPNATIPVGISLSWGYKNWVLACKRVQLSLEQACCSVSPTQINCIFLPFCLMSGNSFPTCVWTMTPTLRVPPRIQGSQQVKRDGRGALRERAATSSSPSGICSKLRNWASVNKRSGLRTLQSQLTTVIGFPSAEWVNSPSHKPAHLHPTARKWAFYGESGSFAHLTTVIPQPRCILDPPGELLTLTKPRPTQERLR